MNLAQSARKVVKTLDTNSPLILTSLAVVGFVGTVVAAIKVTPTAVRVIDKERDRRFEIAENNGDYIFVEPWDRKLDIVKLVWYNYIPVVGMGALSIACVIGAQSINTKRQAALISGFTIAESAFREYREKVTEALGTQREQKVRDEIAQEKMDSNPPSSQVFITGIGDQLCYDTLSGRYFWSTMETLRRAQNDINMQAINEMYASQNDFYRLVNLPINGFGEELGWTTDVPLDIEFTGHIVKDDERYMGMPCIAITYRMSPIRGYSSFG